MSDDLTRAITDALTKRADDTDLPRQPARRTPDTNTPFQATAVRGPRNRSHRDPVGQKATGNVDSERKKRNP